MPKVFIIILLLGLVLMTGRMQLKGKLSDKMGHEAEGVGPIFGNMLTCLTWAGYSTAGIDKCLVAKHQKKHWVL
jgi:hypothetical protein